MANVAKNSVTWIIGPDNDPWAIEIEQTDGTVLPVCQLMEVADATFLGYFISKAGFAAGMAVKQSLESRCGQTRC